MNNKYHICLITSCILPNTKTGPITKLTKEERLIQLINNINFLLETNLFRKIYIIDPVLKSRQSIRDFNSELIVNGLKKSTKVNYIKFNPNEKSKLEIINKGKGYSELEMIIVGTKKIKKSHKNTLIHKISGRYKILNIKNIVKKSEVIFKTEKLLYLTFSRLLSKCYTVLITYKTDIDEQIFNLCLKDIDDSHHRYSEHSFYKNIVKNKIVYRNHKIPKFEFDLLGGSNQGRYGRFKQLINKFLYGFM